MKDFKDFMWQFYDAIDEASLNFDFDQLSDDDKEKAVRAMQIYVEEYFLNK